jgi:hypothetical protein
MGRIAESGVRDPPGAAVELGVKALDQRDLIRLLAVEEIPLVLWIGTDGQRLTLAVRIDQADRDQV